MRQDSLDSLPKQQTILLGNMHISGLCFYLLSDSSRLVVSLLLNHIPRDLLECPAGTLEELRMNF